MIVLTVLIHERYTYVFIQIYLCTGCAGKNLPSFRRTLFMIKENVEQVSKNDGCYTFIYYQIHNKTRRDLQVSAFVNTNKSTFT